MRMEKRSEIIDMGVAMENVIDGIFTTTFDRQEIVDNVRNNLQPILHGRRAGENSKENFKKLSLCLGYHVKKVEILKGIVFTFFKYNTIKKGMDKDQISASVDGIISSESDKDSLLETAHAFLAKASFKSDEQRDASYLMSCMKLIIEGCLLVNFINYISNSRQISFLTFPSDELTETFEKILRERLGSVLQAMIKSM
jgi:hypothetical protein